MELSSEIDKPSLSAYPRVIPRENEVRLLDVSAEIHAASIRRRHLVGSERGRLLDCRDAIEELIDAVDSAILTRIDVTEEQRDQVLALRVRLRIACESLAERILEIEDLIRELKVGITIA